MFRRYIRLAALLLLAAGIGYGIRYYFRPKPLEVVLKPVTKGFVERTVANTRAGTVKACRRARLSPSIGGQIDKLPIHEGDIVKKGQLLLELWNKDILAQLRLSEQEIISARSRARAACLDAEIARRNADRLLALQQRSAISAEQTETAEANAQALLARCQAAGSEVEIRQSQMGVINASLARTRLEAPFEGIVAEINGELYEYVTPSPIGVATLPAVDLLEKDCFYVTAPIDEVDAAAIRVNMQARITMDAFAQRNFEGRVRRIADYVLEIEKQARTVDVEVGFADQNNFKVLLAGYSADIEVIIQVRPNVIRVPTEAVVAGNRVYVFKPAVNRIALKNIVTGLSNWDQTEVISGLSQGELVVVNVDKPGLGDGVLAVPFEALP